MVRSLNWPQVLSPFIEKSMYQVNSNSNHCLFSKIPSASTTVRHTWAAAAAHPLKSEVSRYRGSKFAGAFLSAQVRMWNDLPYTVFDTRTLDRFKGAVNRWLLPWIVFYYSVAQVLVGLQKQLINNLVFTFGPVLLVLIIKIRILTNHFSNVINFFSQ